MDINVSTYQDITNAVAAASAGDDLTFLIENDIIFTAPIIINKALNVTFVNNTSADYVTFITDAGVTGRHFSSGYDGVALNLTFTNIIFDGVNTGGGIIFCPDHGTLIADNCRFQNLRQTSNGAAIIGQTIGTSRTIIRVSNTLFTNNYSNLSSSLFCYDCDLEVTDCQFINNSSRNTAGALFMGRGSAYLGSLGKVTGTLFDNNQISQLNTGGALAIYNTEMVIDQCTFTNNYSPYEGGAIAYSAGVVTDTTASLTIIDSSFTDNWAGQRAGAIFINSDFTDYVKIIDTTFNGNYYTNATPQLSGGAISANSCDNLLIDGAVFTDNRSPYRAGAIYLFSCKSIITDTTFDGNRADNLGGALFVDGTLSQLEIIDTTFLNNTAATSGGAAAFDGNFPVTLIDTTFKGNESSNGGAIITTTRTTILGCSFEQNTADQGGAIYTNALADIIIDSDDNPNITSFINNTADNYLYWTLTDDADSQIHISNIKTNAFSQFSPTTTMNLDWHFTNAYNNYDINYLTDSLHPVQIRFFVEGTTTLIGYTTIISSLGKTVTINPLPEITDSRGIRYLLSPADQSAITIELTDATDYYADFTYRQYQEPYTVTEKFIWKCHEEMHRPVKTEVEAGTSFTGHPLNFKNFTYLGYRIGDGKRQKGIPEIESVDQDLVIYYIYEKRRPCCRCCPRPLISCLFCCCCLSLYRGAGCRRY